MSWQDDRLAWFARQTRQSFPRLWSTNGWYWGFCILGGVVVGYIGVTASGSGYDDFADDEKMSPYGFIAVLVWTAGCIAASYWHDTGAQRRLASLQNDWEEHQDRTKNWEKEQTLLDEYDALCAKYRVSPYLPGATEKLIGAISDEQFLRDCRRFNEDPATASRAKVAILRLQRIDELREVIEEIDNELEDDEEYLESLKEGYGYQEVDELDDDDDDDDEEEGQSEKDKDF